MFPQTCHTLKVWPENRKGRRMYQQILLRGDGAEGGSQWWGCKTEEGKEYGWHFSHLKNYISLSCC